MPTKCKFENIVASEDEVSKLRLPEPRDYHSKILKLEPKGSNHSLDMLTREVIELRKELAKENENHKALEEKIDLQSIQIKEFVMNSNKQLLKDISLLFAKRENSSFTQKARESSNKKAGETFFGGLDFNGAFSPCVDASIHVSRGHDTQVVESAQHEKSQVCKAIVKFAIVGNSESKIDEDVAGIAIEQVLSEVVVDINGEEAVDLNSVEAQPNSSAVNKGKLDCGASTDADAAKGCQKTPQTLDDFMLCAEDLSQICKAEASYLRKKATVEENKKKKAATIEENKKKKKAEKIPGKSVKSPYIQHFESGGTLCVTRQIFEIKHPFSLAIGIDDESDLIDSFTVWLYTGTKKRGKKPYPDVINVLKPAFELGVCNVQAKEWFFKLAHSGQAWNDEHLDVIFYYIRKKRKYETNNNIRFTTTDCLFKTKIAQSYFQLYEAHENKKKFGIKTSDAIAEYICGRHLLASTPWDKVDYVLFPVNIKEGYHWVFVVFDIVERCLKVYDSFPARGGVNFLTQNAAGMISSVLPYYLSVVKFYDKRPELKKSPKYYLLDCGVFVAAFAELVSNGQDIANQQLSADSLRKRFGALLWEYVVKKQKSNLQSEDERPHK
ncbi:uncharacterized protein LOC129871433 [Solanum dulcamara]|uniref:uncharacterized protein LOC129871433 n=1 Tax=Solanum dulcamara TaxID=45834 RepID=UPI002486A8A0|nr:uncharacterized protein LOC129871433 [Solanum dulcamara]